MAIARSFLVILAAAMCLPIAGTAEATDATTSPTTSPATGPTTGPTTQAAVSQEEFETLANQLGSADWKERDAAEKRIIKMGGAAVAKVEALEKSSPDPEVQQRARAILRKIATASLTEPTFVTLKFKNAPPAEVYAELFKQAGAKLEFWPPQLFNMPGRGMPTVTINVDKVPFWEAIKQLEQQTGLFPENMGDELRLKEGRMGARMRAGAGAGADPLGRKREVCVTGPFMVTTDDTFPMITQISVFVEPRVRVLGRAAEPKIDEVTDADGNPAAPDGFGGRAMPQPMAAMRAARAARIEATGGNAFRMHLMRPVPRGGYVRGSVRVSVMTEDQTIEINDLAKANNVERVIDGRRFLLNAMNVDPGEWFITLVAYSADAATSGANIKLEVLDAQGNALASPGRGVSSNGKRVVFNNQYQQGPNVGPPAKLKIVVPKKSRDIDVPFEFGTKPGGKAAGDKRAVEADADENANDEIDKAAAQE